MKRFCEKGERQGQREVVGERQATERRRRQRHGARMSVVF